MTGEVLKCIGGFGVAAAEVRKLVAGRPTTLHGLRSTFRVWPETEGVRCEVAETALGHKVGGKVERAYQRDDLLGERREVMQRWSDYLTGG